MTRARIPDDILAAAHDRAAARAARNWPEADRLRAVIEAAGWKIADSGTNFALSPLHPPDLADEGRTRYGSSASVPSRLADAPVGVASVVLVATDWPQDLERTMRGVREHGPDGTQLIVVADGPSLDQAAALEAIELLEPGGPGIETEVVWTSSRLGTATALNAGIRRASAETVILLDTSTEPTGDFVSPLVAALEDASIAVAGGWGIASDNLRHFEEAGPGDVDAIELYCLAFRRADYVRRGPLDEHFRFYRNLDIWWSLVLRDEGPAAAPRRAVAVDGLPLVRHEHRGWSSVDEVDRDRLSKRNFYRVLDRFGGRRDLLTRSGR